MSISPVVDATPSEDDFHEPMVLDDGSTEVDDSQMSETHHDSISPSKLRPAFVRSPSPVELPTRQPTFLSAPRFKTSEALEAGPDHPPLPEAFSPQRRGAKYVTGGLAAEVRDWLVQVKGASEYDRPTGESVRLIVDQVRPSYHGRMCTISGNEVGGTQGQNGNGESKPARVILAGDGRIAGLRGRTVVSEGGTISMYQPMWDINLKDLGRFAVACDWDGEGQKS